MSARRRSGAAAAVLAALLVAAVLVAPWRADVRSEPIVVAIKQPAAAGNLDIGTGFAVEPTRIVTVAHVLDSGARVLVRGPDGRDRAARVLRIDRNDDLALLAVARLPGRTLHVRLGGGGPSNVLVERGGRTVPLAARLRRRITATLHTPTATYIRPALELDGRVTRGDSGAPVVDRSGAVAGVVFASSDAHPQVTYAVDARRVVALLR